MVETRFRDWGGVVTNPDGARSDGVLPTAVDGATRFYYAAAQNLGPLSSGFTDLLGHAAMVPSAGQTTPNVVDDSGRRYVRFNGTLDELADTTLGVVAQPFTIILVARLTGAMANKFLVASTASGGMTFGTTTTNFQMNGGTAFIGNSSPALDTTLRTFILQYSGGTSVRSIDNVESIGNVGNNGLNGIRLAAQSNLASHTAMDVFSLEFIPGVLTAPQRAAAYTKVTGRPALVGA
jgi:hypothetical protein